MLPIRAADGSPAATTCSWEQITKAAASKIESSVYRACMLPSPISTGGYRSIGQSRDIITLVSETDL